MSSNLGSLLTDTSMRLETFARQTSSKPEEIPKGLKAASVLLSTTNESLGLALKNRALLADFDQKEIKKVLAYIAKLNQHAPLQDKNTPFLKVLRDLQNNLKDLAKQQKELPPVQLKGLGRTTEVLTNGLSKHLHMADEKLSDLTKNFKAPLAPDQLKDLSKILDKATLELMKTEAFKSSKGFQLPSQNMVVIQRILKNIQHLDQHVSVQVMAATYKAQVSKFKDSLKELEKRLYVLNQLKKTRGKQASLVEKETR